MGFIDLPGFGDIGEAQVQDDGEYELQVVDVHKYQNDNGRWIVRIRHEFVGIDDAAPLTHWFSLPKEEDELSVQQMMMRDLKRYLYLVGVPFEANGFNEEDLAAVSFTANVTKEFNEERDLYFNDFKLPRIPSEG